MPKGKDRTLAVKIGITLLLATCYLLPVPRQEFGASFGSPWHTHFIAQMFHTNAFHLLANLYALWLMRTSPRELLAAYVLSIPATFATATPAVGFSSVLYALMGMKIGHARMSRIEWVMFVLANVATVFIPAIAFGVHLAAFIMGLVYDYIKRLTDEYRRACNRK